jgi:hypothetical protein
MVSLKLGIYEMIQIEHAGLSILSQYYSSQSPVLRQEYSSLFCLITF